MDGVIAGELGSFVEEYWNVVEIGGLAELVCCKIFVLVEGMDEIVFEDMLEIVVAVVVVTGIDVDDDDDDDI